MYKNSGFCRGRKSLWKGRLSGGVDTETSVKTGPLSDRDFCSLARSALSVQQFFPGKIDGGKTTEQALIPGNRAENCLTGEFSCRQKQEENNKG